MIDITVEDVAALRKQGDFREFLRLQFPVEQAALRRPDPKPAVVEHDPGHRPGTWPTGTRPPEPAPAIPREQWEHAVVAYRQWLAAGSPADDFTCECGCTPRRTR